MRAVKARAVATLFLAVPFVLVGVDDASARAPAARAEASSKHVASKKAASTDPVGQARVRKARSRTALPKTHGHAALPLPILDATIRCPVDMVAVAGRVCVDRYEVAIEDRFSGTRWSPFFTPDLARATKVAGAYAAGRERAEEGTLDRMLAVPEPPTEDVTPRAVSLADVLPQGYLSADQADTACRAAGKRLCSEAEWVTACRGEEQRDFPYGDHYEQGVCNVNRENHPSAMLHGNAARYHDDPRNNLVAFEGRPLLRETGATTRCASHWASDAIYDMVGNLDEWVDDPNGVFVGGFYSRGTKSGCASRVSAHPRGYSDYSIGARCCRDPD